jgi:hypothetical protein
LEQIDFQQILSSSNVNEINEFIIKNINERCKNSIPFKSSNKPFKVKLPQYLVFLIKQKRYLKKRKRFDPAAKQDFYIISKTIKEELDVIKNQNWSNFSYKTKDNLLVTKQFWKRINNIKNKDAQNNDYYPKLIHDNKEYKSDLEKANIFGTLLGEIFKDDQDEKYV